MTGAAGPAPQRLVLATANQHKLLELKRILAAGHVDVPLASLAEFPGAPDVAETGATFAENALLKAHAIAEFTGLPAVADDSGLCVDALNGMPGVLSARWSGQARRRRGQPAAGAGPARGRAGRAARRAVRLRGALVLPDGREHVSEGVLHGRLIREPRGQQRVRLRPDLRARFCDNHDRRDGPGGERQDQSPRQGIATAGARNRCVPWLVSHENSRRGNEHDRHTPGSR